MKNAANLWIFLSCDCSVVSHLYGVYNSCLTPLDLFLGFPQSPFILFLCMLFKHHIFVPASKSGH